MDKSEFDEYCEEVKNRGYSAPTYWFDKPTWEYLIKNGIIKVYYQGGYHKTCPMRQEQIGKID